MITSLLWGTAIGLVLGLLGGGGALLAIPVLLYAFHFSLRAAIGSSLFLVALGALPAVLLYFRKNEIDLKAVIILGISGAVGAYAGSHMSHTTPQTVLYGMLLVAMAVAALFMLKPRPQNTPDLPSALPHQSLLLVASGLGIGVTTGMLGLGGGFLLIPVLTLVARVPARQAIATSLAIITVNALSGAIGYHASLPFHDSTFQWLSLGMVAGSIVGFKLSYRFSNQQLKQGFGALLLLLIGVMILFPVKN